MMKKLIAVVLLLLSFNAPALDKQGSNTYNPHSYGAPQLYYSPEERQEREELELLKKSNRIAKEQLEIDRERLREEREYERRSYGYE